MQLTTLLPLEDNYTDVLNKARRGLKLTFEDLSERVGIPAEDIHRVLNGTVDRLRIEQLAFVLSLHGPSLVALAQGAWSPKPVSDFAGLAMFTTDYGDMTVNAYLAWDLKTREAVSFDTGATCEPMLDFLKQENLTLKRAFITHTHMDHLADLDRLLGETQAVGYGSAVENPLGLKPLSPKAGLVIGDLKIRVLGTSGHTPGGLSYFIQGLARPIVVVGDALFAGSMGGAYHAYAEALENIEKYLLTLPDHTVICPGHGPLTSVGEEKAHNPFFPRFK